MGFYIDHNNDDGGIELDTSRNVDVQYRTLSNPTQSELESSSLCIGPAGDINTQSDISGAPVITAVIGKDSCTFYNTYIFKLPWLYTINFI